MKPSSSHARRRRPQRGITAVEFALVAMIFFTVAFGIVELARVIYMYNTLADVTRSAARAAANIDWRNAAALDQAKQRAIFRDAPGGLPFGSPITDQHIRIDYLYLKQQAASVSMEPIAAGLMPSCPGRNRHNCLTSPYGGAGAGPNTCVRLVRARICQPGGGACKGVNYQMLVPFLDLDIMLPLSTTITSAQSLGYQSGDPVCP